MSYEGQEQHLCANGHLCTLDAREEKDSCCTCEAPLVWSNAIDDTNGDCWGIILESDWVKFELTPDKIETCNLGHRHMTAHATYRAPTALELSDVRCCWDSGDGRWRLIKELETEQLIRDAILAEVKIWCGHTRC